MSYSKKYFQIYIWQGLAFVLNFLSMFIVVPYLSSSPEIYGIYSVCVAVTIFFSYADLGFIGAGQKYAAESFARQDRTKEIRIIGFSNFILMALLLLFAAVFAFLSFKPELLISGLEDGHQRKIASSLLLILAVFTPVTLLQRITQMIFGIRVEDYVIQRVNILANLLKIASVLFFLTKDTYNIVGYFFFIQLLSLVAAVVVLLLAKKRYSYDFKLLFRSLRFDKEIYHQIKGLSFNGLFLTITWILYYELDTIVISKMLGAEKVAIFAIGVTIMSFFRTIYAVVFAPFSARFNHFTGVNDNQGLKDIYFKVSSLLAPVVIIPVIAVCLMLKPLILSWVGQDYMESVAISRLLVACFIYGFITYPASILLTAKVRTKELYLAGAIIPVIYWLGIWLSYSSLGLQSFGIFKFVAFSINAVAMLIIVQKHIDIPPGKIFRYFIAPSIPSVVFIVVVSILAVMYLPAEKSKPHLLLAAVTTGAIIGMAFLLLYLTSGYIRTSVNSLFRLKKESTF